MSQYQFGDFTFYTDDYLLKCTNIQINLRGKVGQCLIFFLTHPNQVHSKESLRKNIWGEVSVAENSIDQTISSLRKTLGDNPKNPKFIKTIKSRGYQWIYSDIKDGSTEPEQEVKIVHSTPKKWWKNRRLQATALVLALIGLFWFRYTDDAFPSDQPFKVATLPFQVKIDGDQFNWTRLGLMDYLNQDLKNIDNASLLSSYKLMKWMKLGGFTPESEWTSEHKKSLFTRFDLDMLIIPILMKTEKSLIFSLSVEDPEGQVLFHRSIRGLDEILITQNAKDQLLTYFSRSKVPHLSNVLPEAQKQFQIGMGYYLANEKSRSLPFFRSSFTLDPTFEKARLYEAKCLLHTGQKEKGIAIYEELHKSCVNLEVRADSTRQLGIICKNQGEMDRAKELLNTALEIHPKNKQWPRFEMATLTNLSQLYDRSGDPDKAMELLKLAASNALKNGDHRLHATTLNNIGGILQSGGQLEKALEYYQRSIQISKEQGDVELELDTNQNLAMLEAEWGNTDKAIKLFERNLALARDIQHVENEAFALKSLGTTYLKVNDLEHAEQYLKEGMSAYANLKDAFFQSICMHNLGTVQQRRKEYLKAEQIFQETAAICKKANDHYGEALAYYEIARTFNDLADHKDLKKAKTYLDLAKPYFDQRPDSDYSELSALYAYHKNDFKNAVYLQEQAKTIVAKHWTQKKESRLETYKKSLQSGKKIALQPVEIP